VDLGLVLLVLHCREGIWHDFRIVVMVVGAAAHRSVTQPACEALGAVMKEIMAITKGRGYDSTVARMAGNIAAGLVDSYVLTTCEAKAGYAVRLARAIIAETKATESTEGAINNG
jgi:hypothetical protein